jgi:hypothetical protein
MILCARGGYQITVLPGLYFIKSRPGSGKVRYLGPLLIKHIGFPMDTLTHMFDISAQFQDFPVYYALASNRCFV